MRRKLERREETWLQNSPLANAWPSFLPRNLFLYPFPSIHPTTMHQPDSISQKQQSIGWAEQSRGKRPFPLFSKSYFSPFFPFLFYWPFILMSGHGKSLCHIFLLLWMEKRWRRNEVVSELKRNLLVRIDPLSSCWTDGFLCSSWPCGLFVLQKAFNLIRFLIIPSGFSHANALSSRSKTFLLAPRLSFQQVHQCRFRVATCVFQLLVHSAWQLLLLNQPWPPCLDLESHNCEWGICIWGEEWDLWIA